jgi:hypothetical protein
MRGVVAPVGWHEVVRRELARRRSTESLADRRFAPLLHHYQLSNGILYGHLRQIDSTNKSKSIATERRMRDLIEELDKVLS